MNRVDRSRMKRAFEGHAITYDNHAKVQKEIIHRQCKLVKEAGVNPARILDVGCGTGALLHNLIDLFPHARLVGIDLALGMTQSARTRLQATPAELVNGDAEALPFRSRSFELVVSTSTFQWLQDLAPAFSEVHRVLMPLGYFFFSFFGERTLHELRASYKKACLQLGKGDQERPHSFAGVDDVATALEKTGFKQVRLFSELMVERHVDVPDLLHGLKMIGAGNASPRDGGTMPNRKLVLEMMRIYRSEYGDFAGIPATYDVIYGVAEKDVRCSSMLA